MFLMQMPFHMVELPPVQREAETLWRAKVLDHHGRTVSEADSVRHQAHANYLAVNRARDFAKQLRHMANPPKDAEPAAPTDGNAGWF